MSVGRQVCKQLIATAEDLRRYALLVDEFDDYPQNSLISAEARRLADHLEGLIRPILIFEGENMRALMPAVSS